MSNNINEDLEINSNFNEMKIKRKLATERVQYLTKKLESNSDADKDNIKKLIRDKKIDIIMMDSFVREYNKEFETNYSIED